MARDEISFHLNELVNGRPVISCSYNNVPDGNLLSGRLTYYGDATQQVNFITYKNRERAEKVFNQNISLVSEEDRVMRAYCLLTCPHTNRHLVCFEHFQKIPIVELDVNHNIDNWWCENASGIIMALWNCQQMKAYNDALQRKETYGVANGKLKFINTGDMNDKTKTRRIRIGYELKGMQTFMAEVFVGVDEDLNPHKKYFLELFVKNTKQSVINTDLLKFDKLAKSPFLMLPQSRLAYSYELGKCYQIKDFKYNSHDDLTKQFQFNGLIFNDSIQWLEKLNQNVGLHASLLLCRNHKIEGAGQDRIVENYKFGNMSHLLRFIKNLVSHYGKSCDANDLDAGITKIAGGFISIVHECTVLYEES